ncbi:MAG: c-type cytochrome [Betaproteobacteria bacterium]|nr:c-type cytochrome [Betaproteobacteria bacterium]
MRSAIPRTGAWCAGLALAATVAVPVAAQDVQARAWAASCAACHGTDGRSTGAVPPLAGRPKADLLRAMQDFKSGKRSATIMHQHAKGYTDAELERIADYFSKVSR